MIQYALIFILTLATTGLYAQDDCEEINLNDEDIGLEKIPLWEQEETYLCYGYSGAILVDSHRYTTGQSQLTEYFTSPFALSAQAVHYSQRLRTRSNFWGGLVDHSLLSANEFGSCQSQWLTRGFRNLGPQKSLQLLRDFRLRARNLNDEQELYSLAQELNLILAELGIPSQILPSPQDLATWFKLREDIYIPQVVATLCADQENIVLPEPQSQDRSLRPGQLNMGQRLNILMQAKKPTAVEFCAEVVTDRNYSPGWNGNCGRHYVVIVGQRRRDNKCEYLVRDSQCSAYEAKGKSICHEGQFWIERSAFLSNSYRMTWL